MASPLVAHLIAGSTTGNSFTTGSITTTGSSLIVVGCVNSTGGATITDSNSNVYTALTATTFGATITVQLFYVSNPTVGSGHTFTATVAAGTAPTLGILAFSSPSASPFDQENGAGVNANTNGLQPGSVTPTQDGEVVVAMFGSNTAAIANGFGLAPGDLPMTTTDIITLSAGNHFAAITSYGVQPTAAAVNPRFEWLTNSTLNAARIATFKAAVSTGGATAQVFC